MRIEYFNRKRKTVDWKIKSVFNITLIHTLVSFLDFIIKRNRWPTVPFIGLVLIHRFSWHKNKFPWIWLFAVIVVAAPTHTMLGFACCSYIHNSTNNKVRLSFLLIIAIDWRHRQKEKQKYFCILPTKLMSVCWDKWCMSCSRMTIPCCVCLHDKWVHRLKKMVRYLLILCFLLAGTLFVKRVYNPLFSIENFLSILIESLSFH